MVGQKLSMAQYCTQAHTHTCVNNGSTIPRWPINEEGCIYAAEKVGRSGIYVSPQKLTPWHDNTLSLARFPILSLSFFHSYSLHDSFSMALHLLILVVPYSSVSSIYPAQPKKHALSTVIKPTVNDSMLAMVSGGAGGSRVMEVAA